MNRYTQYISAAAGDSPAQRLDARFKVLAVGILSFAVWEIDTLAGLALSALPVTVWIGQDDSLLRRARLEGPINNEEGDDIRRQIELSGFDEPVTIEPPETG